jgi:hypothetical protein
MTLSHAADVTQADKLNDMVAGDFKGDGNHEIAGLTILPSGGLKLEVYTVDPGSLTTNLASALALTTPDTPIAPSKVSMARGRFTSANHDQLAVAFASNSGKAHVEIIDFKPNTLTPFEASPPLFTPDTAR